MASKITMPRLSDTMTEGVVATWLKKVGDTIKEGDILAEIETDKATMEFEAFEAGTLLYIGIEEGVAAPVDSLIAIIGQSGEDITSIINEKSQTVNSDTISKPEISNSVTESNEISQPNNSSVQIPDDVKIITMPRLSDTMTEGTVASWLKKIGDKISEGDILAEIETDKATMEFEAFESGTLLHIGVQEGQTASVDAVLAILGPEGTDVSVFLNGASVKQNEIAKPNEVISNPINLDTNKIDTSEHIDVVNSGRILASPLAKKIAEDKGVDLRIVKGSGENGRVVKADVENFTPSNIVSNAIKTDEVIVNKDSKASVLSTENVSVAKSSNTIVILGEKQIEEVKNSSMRKTIAKRLAESKFTAPHYYLTIEVDMDGAIASRKLINAIPDTKVSFNDMVIKACAMALKKHPKVNSQWTEAATIINHHVNIGVAVAVEDGLVVPVLNFTDQLTLSQIGTSVKDLAGKARNKKLSPAEMDGSTFTISNLGMFGIKEFTSIINQPNSAILSVGAIVEKPVVKNSQIVVGNTMIVTLACDHRTVDGATGAEFLQTLKTFLENPVTMLV